jgi:geranylgeranyl pyrophosphate synthase
MPLSDIVAQVLDFPQVAAWPEMADAFNHAMTEHRIKLWEFPVQACQAVGGDGASAVPAAAAISCLQLGLMLIDDMLDEDPRGAYHQLGQAATANMAFAFQSAAFRVLADVPAEAERRAALYASLAQMTLTVALGQYLDSRNLDDEEGYWRVAETKSAPYFGSALQIGALLGGAPPDVGQRLYEIGFLVGVGINVYDDLMDALETPAKPDWAQGRNNLAILYALTADHPGRAEFEALRAQADDPPALDAAQRILIQSGAVSYCVYHIVRRNQAARQLLDGIPLADPRALRELIAGHTRPLVGLLESAGAAIPPELETLT